MLLMSHDSYLHESCILRSKTAMCYNFKILKQTQITLINSWCHHMMNLSVIICGTKQSVDVAHFQKMEEVSLIHVKRQVNKINSIELFSQRQKGLFHT